MPLPRALANVATAVRDNWKVVSLAVIASEPLLGRRWARSFVKGYIRQLAKKKLRTSIKVAGAQIVMLAIACGVVQFISDALVLRLVGSGLVIAVGLYNMTHLVFSSLPELLRVRKELKKGLNRFVLRHMLAVSIVKTLVVEWELCLLGLCVVTGSLVRWGLTHSFSLMDPWIELLT